MQRHTTTIPKAAVARILTKMGAKRVSDSAAKALSDVVEKITLDIASKSVELAHHSKRKTVMEEDIKLAVKE
jgi:histone H3/H4|tara:strand:+ start:1336 stop:1551 length:216 start_codon:yes stop_codon:yes gene_type:complete